jgi:hypothetical protein
MTTLIRRNQKNSSSSADASGIWPHFSSQLILSMLFTSYLHSSRVPKAGEIFLFLPKSTGIGVLQAGDVLALMRRGAQGRPGQAAARTSAS